MIDLDEILNRPNSENYSDGTSDGSADVSPAEAFAIIAELRAARRVVEVARLSSAVDMRDVLDEYDAVTEKGWGK